MRLSQWPFLLLLLLIPVLHRWWSRRNQPAQVHFPLPIPRSIASTNPLRAVLMLRYLGIGFLILALARPQSSFKETERTVSGVDIILVLDVSASMAAEDLADRSRLDVAKETMEKFIRGRQNDRIGFVIFSGEPLTLAPLTLDYGLVLQQLRNASMGVLRDGTAIGDGLSLAVNHLRNSKSKSRLIVLLTDGDNNVGQVDPATAGELAAGYGLRVYSIAIGKEGRVKVPTRRQGPFGNPVVTYHWQENALNPELLQFISQKTQGKFYRVQDSNALASVFSEIDQLEKTDITAHERVRYDELFQIPLKLGLLLLLLEQVLGRLWWRILP